MRIVIMGSGYVGLVSGVCFSDFGHDVTCIDQNAEKINTLRCGIVPIYEPQLEAMMAKNVASNRLRFTTDLSPAVADAEIVCIAVGTPARRGDGRADLRYVESAIDAIAPLLSAGTVVALKSTVPVGTNAAMAARLRRHRPDLQIDVVSNPEFLREGAAVEDFMRPDRIVVGAESPHGEAVMRMLYRPLSLRDTQMLVTNLQTAELIKYASNAFLAVKVTFINEIADLCEKVGGDVQDVARGMGLDRRIGPKFLHPGPGYGGSCFPKDTLALTQTGREYGTPQRIVETTIDVNERRKRRIVDRIAEMLDDRLNKRRITIFGVTFKPETDDMRDAPALTIVPALVGAGAQVTVCDPQGMREGAQLLPGVTWQADPYEAAAGSDAVVVLTEWNMFRGLNLVRLREAMAGDVLIDLRNVYRPEDAMAAGLHYSAVGRFVKYNGMDPTTARATHQRAC